MKLHGPGATISSDGRSPLEAAPSVTHLAVGAHPDDVEFMAYHGIETCYGREDRGFGAVVCTDGAGTPRAGVYSGLDDEGMRLVRRREQLAAAATGRYALTVMLDYKSAELKDARDPRPDEDLLEVLRATRPEVVYTHNPADKHATHVATTGRVLRVLRSLPPELRPRELLACEVWRDLDWVPDEKKRILDAGKRAHLAAALSACFDSQIAGGKRYDLAVLGRRQANATFLESHAADKMSMVTLALDLSPLMNDPDLTLVAFLEELMDEMKRQVRKELEPWT